MTTPNGAPGAQQTIVTKTGPGASAPVQPTTPAPAATAAPDPVAEAKKYRDEGQAAWEAAEKKARVNANESRKFASDKTGLGAKLTEYEQLKKYRADQERLDSQAKLNKAAFLESKFGKDWYDQIVQERINGGAPTADTVALEVAKVEERFKGELDKRDQAAAAERAQAEQRSIENELQQFRAEATGFAKANATEYPIFKRLGDEAAIGAQLDAWIRGEHSRTGKVLTFKEAADALESNMLAIAEEALGAEKYRSKLTEKLKPANTSAVGGGPQQRSTEAERRTLSNNLTATTPGQKRPYRTDEQRRADAIAAVDALKRS